MVISDKPVIKPWKLLVVFNTKYLFPSRLSIPCSTSLSSSVLVPYNFHLFEEAEKDIFEKRRAGEISM